MMIINSYRYAGGAPAAWTPANLASLVAWYDASDLSTITESGGLVSQWDDKSGTNNHVTQANASDQPKTGIDTLNSLNVLTFNNDLLLNTSFAGLSNNYITIYQVVKVDTYVTGAAIITTIGSSNSLTLRQYQVYAYQSPEENIAATWSSGNVNNSAAAASLVSTTFEIWGMRVDFITNQVVESNVNGGAWSQTSLSGLTPHTNATRLNIGRIATENSTGINLRGKIAEKVISAVYQNNTDTQKIEGYLAHKWGLTADLPAGHPYKTVAP